MWVKICGITRYEDAVAALELGADAVGFVLTKSRRRANPEQLRAWVCKLGDIEKVGVFTNEAPQDIIRVATELRLDTVQVHGTLSDEYRPVAEKFSLIHAVRNMHECMKTETIPCRILVDSSMGNGMRGSWCRSILPVILAGGLTPDNVKEAIAQANPVGVDVSSGVESAPGIKDTALMERFIKEARS